MVVGKNNKMQNHINYRYTSLSHLDISVPNIEFKMYKVLTSLFYHRMRVILQDGRTFIGQFKVTQDWLICALVSHIVNSRRLTST